MSTTSNTTTKGHKRVCCFYHQRVGVVKKASEHVGFCRLILHVLWAFCSGLQVPLLSLMLSSWLSWWPLGMLATVPPDIRGPLYRNHPFEVHSSMWSVWQRQLHRLQSLHVT